MDTAASHTVEVVKTELTKLNTNIKFIEGGMTPLLQVMDTHVNKTFKDILKNRWAEWLDHGEEDFTRTGKRRRASYEMIASWVEEAWRHITPELILIGSRECGYIQWDGNFDNLHSRFRETIVRQEVPLDVIAEVDNLLLELEQERREVMLDDETNENDDSDDREISDEEDFQEIIVTGNEESDDEEIDI